MNTRPNTGMRTLIFLTMTSMIILGAGTVLAQGPGAGSGPGYGNGHGSGRGFGDGEFGPGYRLEILADHLELTEDQMTAVKGIQTLCREKNMELRKELMRLRNELQGEMLKDDPSEKVALDLNGKVGALGTEIQSNRMKSRLEVRRQLTPEQRDKMLMLHQRFQGREGRRGAGRGMGPRDDGDLNGPGCGKRRGGARGNW